MANDMIRMSGMNSGLDTESIINALTANTKLKATKQERNVLKYEATQEAYRDIISKMQTIKNKYFDILNKDSYMAGASIWNKYSSKVLDSNNLETLASGISVTTSINSNPGEYKVAVNKTAKQAKLKGAPISGSAKVDLSSLENNKEYGMTVTVGDTTKTIKFTAGADAEATRGKINQALEDEFGESNESRGDGTEGMVYVASDGSLVSRAAKGITMSGIGTMSGTNTIDLSKEGLQSGTNTVTFQVGNNTVSTSFQTVKSDYFDLALNNGFIKDDGTALNQWTVSDPYSYANLANYHNPEWDSKIDAILDSEAAEHPEWSEEGNYGRDVRRSELEVEIHQAVSTYTAVLDDYKESKRYTQFTDWKASATEADINTLYNEARADQKDNIISGWVAKDDDMKAAYETYKNEFAENKLTDAQKADYQTYKDEKGEDAKGIYDWAQDYVATKKTLDSATGFKSAYEYAQTNDDFAEKVSLLENKFEGTGNGTINYNDEYYTTGYDAYKHSYAASHLSDSARAAYDTYKDGLDDPTTAKSLYDWATSDEEGLGNEAAKAEISAAQTDDPIKDFDSWKSYQIDKDSWALDKETWEASESSMFSSFKKSAEFFHEPVLTDDEKSAANIIDHFNESALKNSIGKLELDDGTKFDVTYDSENNTATVKAYTESTDDEGNTTKNYIQSAITIGKNSANSAETLGNKGADESTSISQITNSTKLSDIGAKADENGNYNFKINDVSFSFDGDTTVNDMMKKINASTAGVKMTYSSLDNAFTVTANKYGLAGEIKVEDSDGGNLMDLLNLSDGDFTHGENLEVYINGTLYESETNSIEVDGSTFTISNLAKEPKENEDPVEYTVSVGKDTSAIKDLIKDFVKDYNQLIEDVYKYLDEKPEKDYYFLTDSDKEDLDLTEKQEEKWEAKAKAGLLYHDSITTTIMTGLRTSLMGTVEGLDGNIFSLSSMGLKTVSDYNKHGMFAAVDEDKLDLAIENHLDDIQKLFSDSENGIMKKFSNALDLGIGTTGKDKGTLIRKAGLATGSSSKDNEIYNAIKRTKSKITTLNQRYENEQNRLWKRYSNMESLLGTMNSQQASFMSYFQQ